ncbi:MAG: helix-turn-helix domain-containing protein [Eubacteriales bacterium]|nr:helix-turn-helix domain-containing protein [Eubacteriales bacterium]
MSTKMSYTPAEIQQILRISHPTVYKLIAQNVFQVVRIRGRIRIVKSSFDAWLDGEEED